MIDPGLLRVGDWVLFVSGIWLEVGHTPWHVAPPVEDWWFGAWHYDGDQRWLYTPACLRGVVALWRGNMEIWNAETALEQQSLPIE